ncbi:sensor histidine kinase [Nocardia farcinica]|uniref:sensor histidine kinase n=1 Tax=Nocardia farcinica TaxID=37329 RepID=UPI003CC80D3B
MRAKLTLSYVGFLMLAGALLLAAVWVFLLRGRSNALFVPDLSDFRRVFDPGSFGAAVFVPAAILVLGFLLVFGLVGGWILAGRVLSPLTRITQATRAAASGSLSLRIRLPGRSDEFRELADSFDTMLAQLEAHVAEQRRFAANASHELRTPLAITQALLDVARNDPDVDTGELIRRLRTVNTRAIDLTEALLLLSRADQRSFPRAHVDLSLMAEEAAETLLPLAEERGIAMETSGDITPTMGSPALLLQLITNLVHNAIIYNVPDRGSVSQDQRASRYGRDHCREHRRKGVAARGSHAGRTVSPRHRTRARRPRGCRAGPGDRPEHHARSQRNPNPHSPSLRRAPSHRATTCGTVTHRRLTGGLRSVAQASAVCRSRRADETGLGLPTAHGFRSVAPRLGVHAADLSGCRVGWRRMAIDRRVP